MREPSRAPLPPLPLPRALLAFAIGWVMFTWPWLSGAVTVPWDAKAHFYPQILFLAQAIHSGESPFWTPHVFAGHPQIADPQSLIFSPPMLILALLNPAPSFAAVDATVFAALGAGGIAVILIFRDRRWHWAGAVIAALVFCFGGSAAWRIQHVGQVLSLAYLPIAFLLLDRALLRGSLLYGAAAGLVAGVMVLGRDQVALLGTYLLVLHVVVHWAKGRGALARLRGSLGPLTAGAVVGIAIVALPLLMSVLFGAQSNRPAIDLEGAGRGSLHPVHLLTLFVADLYASSGPMADMWGPPSFTWHWEGIFLAQNMFVLYVGAIPLLAVLAIGLVRGTMAARDVRPFAVAAALMLLYALGWYTPFFRAVYEVLPGIALFRRPADATFLFGALLGIVAGHAIHRLLTDPPAPFALRQRALAVLLVGLPIIAAIGLAIRFDRILTNAFLPLVTAAVCLSIGALALLLLPRVEARHTRLAGGLLVLLTAADLAWNNGPNGSTALPPADYAVLRPNGGDPVIADLLRRTAEGETDTRRDRVELAGLGFHWPNASLVHGLEHTLGYNPLRIGVYSAGAGAGDTIGLPDQRQFPPLFPSYRSTLANLLGLRFIVTPVPIETVDRALPPGYFALIGRPGGAYLYENTATLPRVVLATSVVLTETDTLIRTGRWPEADLARAVVLERLPAGAERLSGAEGRARIVSAHNTQVIVEAFAPQGGGFVVLMDSFHPWWRADVDGRPAPILRANALFRAVQVPEGQSRVRFLFRPFTGAVEEAIARLRAR